MVSFIPNEFWVSTFLMSRKILNFRQKLPAGATLILSSQRSPIYHLVTNPQAQKMLIFMPSVAILLC